MTRWNRQVWVCLLLVTTCVAVASPQVGHAADGQRPANVVLILVDDQGYYDLGCYGASEVATPHIDRLAREGVRLTDYYAAAPICSPSRAGLLTGCYPRRVGNHIWVHRADSHSGLAAEELTVAELFQQHGYATACIGKWHLGFLEPYLPRAQGFDHFFGLLHNLDPVETVYFGEEGVPLLRDGTVVKQPADPAELTERSTDEAIAFLERHQDQPFFLYLPFTMLHQPLGVSEAFQGSSQWGEYGDAIQELDFHVGRLMETLTRLHLHDNTVVVYLSDNGRGPGRTPEQPIRGSKLSTLEGGIRVPAICWGPGLGIQQGKASSAVVRAMDWYPTLATLAGVAVPSERVLDGRDITPLLRGQSEEVPPADQGGSLNASVPLRRSWNPPREWAELLTREEYNNAFFYHGSEGALAAVRWEAWKLVLSPSLTLYNLAEDPGESRPVRNAAMARKLRGMAVLFEQEMQTDARRAEPVQPALRKLTAAQRAVQATFRLHGPGGSGTAFVVQHAESGESPPSQLLVSAAHTFENITSQEATLVVRRCDESGNWTREDLHLRLRSDEGPLWTRHPSADVAVLSIELPPHAACTPFTLADVATAADFDTGRVSVGQQARVACFPAQTESDAAGWPVLRTGHVATPQLSPAIGLQQFFVDYAHFAGDSGAAVVVEGPSPSVVGVVVGMQRQTDRISSPYEEKTMHTPLGLAIVVPSTRVREVIELWEATANTRPESSGSARKTSSGLTP
jgi:arylsulfatase A